MPQHGMSLSLFTSVTLQLQLILPSLQSPFLEEEAALDGKKPILPQTELEPFMWTEATWFVVLFT
jgi:hypothetical protein